MDRELGLTQVKLCLPSGYVQPDDVVVAVDCKRSDGVSETVEVLIPAGTRGPGEDDPVGQVVRVRPVDKGLAEDMSAPYAGAGLYTAVTGVRVVQAPASGQCRFTLVNDAPLLASAAGIPVREREPSHVAWQMSQPWSEPHVLDDAVGQVFLFLRARGRHLDDPAGGAARGVGDGAAAHSGREQSASGGGEGRERQAGTGLGAWWAGGGGAERGRRRDVGGMRERRYGEVADGC